MRVVPRAAVAVTGVLAAALLSGCAQPARPVAAAPAAPTPSAAPAEEPQSEPAYDWAPEVTDDPTPEVPEGRRDRFKEDWKPGDREATLAEWLYFAVDPPGRRREIALRFAQALQQHDDFAAGLEMNSMTRTWLQHVGNPQLHAYIADIRRHAGLDAAPACTRSQDLDADSAVVTCGRVNVVVHLNDTFPGVVVSDWAVHDDVFPGPHTHAYSPTATWDL